MARGYVLGAGFALLACAVFVLPLSASAATLSTTSSQTQQILPPGTNTCQQLQVQSVVPYVYADGLNSFDITIADPSYVSVIGSVGDTGIPLNRMTRRINPDGSLRIHFDVPSTPVYGRLPVSVTLLSAPPGSPVCVTVVSFSLDGPSAPVPVESVPTTPAITPDKPAPATTTEASAGTTTQSGGGMSAVVGGGLQSALLRACQAAGPYQLWFILLALFMVIVGLTAFAEPPLANRGPALPLSAILIPLVLLLGFWYLAPACRVAGWIPFVLIAASIIGLVTAFRDKEMPLGQVIQLPAAKK